MHYKNDIRNSDEYTIEKMKKIHTFRLLTSQQSSRQSNTTYPRNVECKEEKTNLNDFTTHNNSY